MSELKFTRVNNEEYNTVSINIENAFIPITKEDYNIINTEKTKYGYKKTTIKLINQDLIDKLKLWEEEINDYLKSEGIEPVTILYGNRIYPKVSAYLTEKKEHNINIKSIWVNDKNKPFIQLYYVRHS